MTTLPLPSVCSLTEVELDIDGGYVTRISTPHGSWNILSPHFGEITHDTIFPSYFEMPKIEGGVSGTIIVMPRKGLDDVADFFLKIDKLTKEERGLLKTVGQLYAAAVSTEAVSVSYLLLWEILEVYSNSFPSSSSLLDKQTLNQVRVLLEEKKYKAENVERIVSVLGMLNSQTETQMVSTIIKKKLLPDEKMEEINKLITALRRTRGTITHPKALSGVDRVTLLEHYRQLKEIIDKLLVHLSRSDRYGEKVALGA